ncbi:hypothetical protein INR79_23475 [Vibrio sp. SCSIO 43132]|uniref:DUF6929 family protein n=1 Tax=Vibrio sp. SCSIO 43132 TaxID=2779363 RepID=UPI001CA85630|nr:hypothetical protein [Vibrio sp. SCSIO 43132]UAB72226.1 hypothetical protein INR79_23475 [Vibrio sp. SCSIO 43132]
MKIKNNLLAMMISATVAAPAFASTIEVSDPLLNTSFPSASGVVVEGDKLFAVGDDSPWLYNMDLDFNILSQDLIKHYPIGDNGRILKKVKPDYEAMEAMDINERPSLVVLGSGSKADVREWAYIISQDKGVKIERYLAPLYKQLYRASGFSGNQELNIEGLAVSEDTAYIFNRGNGGSNIIFGMPLVEFEEYLLGKQDAIEELSTYHVTLPNVQGFEAGLSGATYWNETDSLVFTASVEATGDAYNDGEILGSFVGYVPVGKLSESKSTDLSSYAKSIDKNDKPVITKVESVSITVSTPESIRGVLASDNDDGTSEFFSFSLTK